jgi:hypothetical protein
MEHKKFEDLNVLDNFMFNELAMQEDKERSKRFFKILLETILQKKVRNIEVIPQRIIQGTGNANHGIQMDAYVEGCVEEPNMSYNDGSKTLYLYAYGKKDIPSQELANLLKYMAESTKENVVNSNLKDIQGMMDDIKMDSEKGVRYMQSWEIENICFEQGVAQGVAQGKQESILDLLDIFGEIPTELESAIREEKRPEVLTGWLKVARRVDSISEFEERIHQE